MLQRKNPAALVFVDTGFPQRSITGCPENQTCLRQKTTKVPVNNIQKYAAEAVHHMASVSEQ